MRYLLALPQKLCSFITIFFEVITFLLVIIKTRLEKKFPKRREPRFFIKYIKVFLDIILYIFIIIRRKMLLKKMSQKTT